MAPPPTPARLASLSSTLLSQILELTRSSQLSLPAPTLTASILKNLAALRAGIEHLQGGGLTGAVLDGLHEQEERLVGLVEGLGVAVPGRKGKEGRLVDVGDEEEPDESSDVQLLPISRAPHTAITFPDTAAEERDRLAADEEEMRRANTDVMQMQRRMLDDQDETLDSLSSAISRQHFLSLSISEELGTHEQLLESTDAALDRTSSRLRRAGGQLGVVTRKARDTGSTGLIVLLVVILVVLVTVFKS